CLSVERTMEVRPGFAVQEVPQRFITEAYFCDAPAGEIDLDGLQQTVQRIPPERPAHPASVVLAKPCRASRFAIPPHRATPTILDAIRAAQAFTPAERVRAVCIKDGVRRRLAEAEWRYRQPLPDRLFGAHSSGLRGGVFVGQNASDQEVMQRGSVGAALGA